MTTTPVWHPFSKQKNARIPVTIVAGKGALLYAADGKTYIDAVASWWVNLHGHAHPYIAEQVSEQLHTLEHVIFADFTHPTAENLAHRLLETVQLQQQKVFFSDNGSTAVEVALKMALQYWSNDGKSERRRIIALQNAYHGDTFGAMAVGERNIFNRAFHDFLFEVHFVPPPETENLEQSIAVMRQLCNEQTAAFIYEPLVQGAGGMCMHSPEALAELLGIAKQHGVLTIADEVMTGFGRTDTLFASQQIKNPALAPDIMCFSKGLTGGTMALGISTCHQHIYDAFYSDSPLHTFYHGHSYTANPVACRAALASLDLLLEENCTQARAHIAAQHRQFGQRILERYKDKIRDLRQQGTIIAVEINAGEAAHYHHSLRDCMYDFCLQHGVLLRPLGNVLYMMPPYCISDDELNTIYEVIEKGLATDWAVPTTGI